MKNSIKELFDAVMDSDGTIKPVETRQEKVKRAVDRGAYKSNGAQKKWDYSGTKKTTSIRITDDERGLILSHFDSIQAFIQDSISKLT